ncbi:basic amino acid ABC transporter substrate-binding protein [Sediminispirochaeta bajacaliforniensis]|uniref:basic amino acid ABC transporter substrate-binding protein n=1 Tax=Sediminispirochaeta bajacaliforniensis TaxID=148 RepID=UPI00035CF61A|nr:basic amino acid ABC transporter substrate-binding protein [Sediminispirochaeta bajacaliforniensis]
MKRIATLLTAIALVALLSVLSGCQKKNELVMGTNAAFPPFEYIGGADGNAVVGFDVEIAKAIAEKAGKTLRIEDMEFDSLLTALNADKIDFAIAGMTITDEREKSVDFSDPYYEATQAVIVRKADNPISTKDDLNGKKISVQLGTTGNEIAKEFTDDSNIVAFNTGFEAIMELKNGKVDAMIIDEQPAQNFIRQNSDLEIVSLDFDPEYYGIAVKEGKSSELLPIINATLKELKANGTYDKLLSEYMK